MILQYAMTSCLKGYVLAPFYFERCADTILHVCPTAEEKEGKKRRTTGKKPLGRLANFRHEGGCTPNPFCRT